MPTTPDLTSVRTLITSPSKLAKHLGNISVNGIYRWIKVNRIPGDHVIKVANFYDVELGDLLPLCSSEKRNESNLILKDRAVLPTLLKVKSGSMSLSEASDALQLSERSLKLILIHWGDELSTLYETLESLDRKEMSLEQACIRLNVAKYTLHGLRRKYGYAPGHPKKMKPEPTITSRRQILVLAALDVIAGKTAADPKAKEIGVSTRNLFRYIERLTPYKVAELSHWPSSFRVAYAEELKQNGQKYVENWLEFAKTHKFFIKKQSSYPKTPKNWRDQPLRRLLLGVLLGEGTLEEIAAARGADPDILGNLFTSDLRVLELTFNQVQAMGMYHQLALADLLIWSMDRKRIFTENTGDQ